MYPTDSPDFLHFCNWKNVFCLQGSSLKMETVKTELNTVKITIVFNAHMDSLESERARNIF